MDLNLNELARGGEGKTSTTFPLSSAGVDRTVVVDDDHVGIVQSPPTPEDCRGDVVLIDPPRGSRFA